MTPKREAKFKAFVKRRIEKGKLSHHLRKYEKANLVEGLSEKEMGFVDELEY